MNKTFLRDRLEYFNPFLFLTGVQVVFHALLPASRIPPYGKTRWFPV
jgi:hypothetical protein